MKKSLLEKGIIAVTLIGFVLLSGCTLMNKDDETTEAIKKESKGLDSGARRLSEFLNVATWMPGFQKPSDVLFGYDKLVYVSDRQANKIYQFDENGKVLGTYNNIKNPTKMAMDRKGNLYVIGSFDTLGTTLSTIHYLILHSSNQILSDATPLAKKLVHPFYQPSFRGNAAAWSQVKFVGIATYADNSFIVARRGPDNASSGGAALPGGYDNTIVTFNKDRIYTKDLSNYLIPDGSGLLAINNPTALATYANPPQSNNITNSHDFMIGMQGGSEPSGSDNFWRVQGVLAVDSQGETLYEPDNKFYNMDIAKANRFLFDTAIRAGKTTSRFIQPNDIALINASNKQFVFVVDTQLDSVYQFTYSGFEGVPSPNGAGEKNVIVSFGGRPNDGNYSAYQLKNPEGIAFGNNRLYVADTGNRRVLVYKLSTDIIGQ